MSTINDDKIYLYQEGSAFRAPKNTTFPTNPFSATPSSGTGTPVVWDRFGGIEAGVETSPKRDVKKKNIFNKRTAPVKITKGFIENNCKLRVVEFSKAAVLTDLAGGTISETSTGSGVWMWNPGLDETFAFMFIAEDEAAGLTDRTGFWSPAVTVTTPAPFKVDGDTLEGFELELEAIAPFKRFTNFNPLT